MGSRYLPRLIVACTLLVSPASSAAPVIVRPDASAVVVEEVRIISIVGGETATVGWSFRGVHDGGPLEAFTVAVPLPEAAAVDLDRSRLLPALDAATAPTIQAPAAQRCGAAPEHREPEADPQVEPLGTVWVPVGELAPWLAQRGVDREEPDDGDASGGWLVTQFAVGPGPFQTLPLVVEAPVEGVRLALPTVGSAPLPAVLFEVDLATHSLVVDHAIRRDELPVRWLGSASSDYDERVRLQLTGAPPAVVETDVNLSVTAPLRPGGTDLLGALMADGCGDAWRGPLRDMEVAVPACPARVLYRASSAPGCVGTTDLPACGGDARRWLPRLVGEPRRLRRFRLVRRAGPVFERQGGAVTEPIPVATPATDSATTCGVASTLPPVVAPNVVDDSTSEGPLVGDDDDGVTDDGGFVVDVGAATGGGSDDGWETCSGSTEPYPDDDGVAVGDDYETCSGDTSDVADDDYETCSSDTSDVADDDYETCSGDTGSSDTDCRISPRKRARHLTTLTVVMALGALLLRRRRRRRC